MKTTARSLIGRVSILLLAALAIGSYSLSAGAADYTMKLQAGASPSELSLAVGKSRIIETPQALTQVVIGNPAIADVTLLSSTQVLILGKSPGTTNLVLRGDQEKIVALMDVAVGHDIAAIKRQLYRILPKESGLEVRPSNDSVILSGGVSNAMAMDAALAVTNTYAPGKVVNLMQVGGDQQVMLQVRIAEMNRDAGRQFGFTHQITGSAGTQFSGSLLSQGAATAPVATPFSILTLTDTGANFELRLRALESKGLARTLAEPNLVALSGQEAKFLAGGEFGIPVAQSGNVAGAITVEYKPFGVGLTFTPTVLDNDKINLRLAAEVSSINTRGISGSTYPAINTRRTATTVEMADGQSFAVAGLLQSSGTNDVNKFPGLGDLPIIGTLFRSSNFQREETELVVAVTPRLVKPVAGGSLVYPTDNFIPPSEADQYLKGRLEGAEGEGEERSESGVEGRYGHQL